MSGGASGGAGGNGEAARPFPPLPDRLPVDVFDSHCHLDLVGLPVQEQLASAKAAGIARIVTIGVDLPSSRLCADTADEFDDVYAGVAIHPNDTTGITDAVLDDIADLARRPKVRAIGETGLDYYRDWAPKEDQHRSFRAHIEIAKRSGKALVIHDRDAHDDVLRVLEEEGAPERTVFHCFSGDAAMAEVCAERGYVMSFAGNVTFKNAQPLREALAVAPLDLILVETDAPFLTPVPNRGKPNASYLIPHTVRFMADYKGVGLEELCRAIAANGERVFGPW
ncbi:TatD family hydrolase [Actinomadura harenae]|uniref:TatD family deoxyribonuclease n=1 Tax=Actinomadura harenae TaxID=2483351 RepID=A0A3M2LS46_9ACTN|nr:TatD family hydrolase [Actinomadura harenae]RMI40284.1 TatD family deoxyribonuclease [Actinomadura harenae]